MFYPATALALTETSPSPEASVATSPTTSPAPATTPSSTPQPAPSTTPAPGPKKPNGAAANTYTFNKDTGLWENPLYVWDPVTGQTKPKATQNYSYNPATGLWDTTDWQYNAASGSYEANKKSVTAPPAGATSSGSPASGPSGNSAESAKTSSAPTDSNGEYQSPANSTLATNSLATTNSTNGLFNLFYNAAISNKLDSISKSGDANVDGNTSAGSAMSGDASAIANVMNMVQSTFNLLTGDVVTFVRDILGNVTGDLFLNPAQLPSGNTTQTNQTDKNLTVNVKGTGAITNDINLAAASGNARVTNNTQAGNATSGNADAVANVVNLINSAISANKSFLGVLNIRGNLNGDILMPPDALNALLGSNAPSAQIDASSIKNTSLLANLNDKSTIKNDVALSALSGNANVSNNTTAGNAITGSSDTKINVLNLTGSDIIGDNALLVFVNVLGKWTGLIVNAPTGTTAAALGGNTSQQSVENTNVMLNSDTANSITNNIKGNAQTGNANVADNTLAGNATTGNASASANLANLLNTKLNLKSWFGVLFINVFGSWNGSFGVDTEAGNAPRAATTVAPPAAASTQSAFRFVSGENNPNVTLTSRNDQSQKVLASADGSSNSNQSSITSSTTPNSQGPRTVGFSSRYLFPIISGIIGLALIGVEILLRKRRFGTSWKVPGFMKLRSRVDSFSGK